MVNDRRADGDNGKENNPLAKETAQMTFEKGLTPRQLFFLSAAYMLSGAFIFRTRGVFTLAVSFLLWTVISGATVILKTESPTYFPAEYFPPYLRRHAPLPQLWIYLRFTVFIRTRKRSFHARVYFLIGRCMCFLFTEIKLLGRLSELAPYLFAIATLTSLPYLRISLSAFDGGYIFPCFFLQYR